MTMVCALLTLLSAAAAGPAPPGAVSAAVRGALALPSARAEVREVRGALPAGCALRAAEVARPITASGRAAVRLLGAGSGCEAWAWADVEVIAPVLVTTRALAAGSPIAGATAIEERPIAAGRPYLDAPPEDAVTSRPLPAGAPLDAGSLRIGPSPGEPVKVLFRTGALEVESSGRSVACHRGLACAVLPSGKRVEGAWHGGRIVLDRS